MFTVLKNLSNLMTIAGDYVIYGNTYSWQASAVWVWWLSQGVWVQADYARDCTCVSSPRGVEAVQGQVTSRTTMQHEPGC